MLLQALADYAVLIEKLRHEWESPDSAVIGFGGSYGGMLAAWFRMKYPNMLDGEQSCMNGPLAHIFVPVYLHCPFHSIRP
jgi:pimeloyl-ACP methyl ester carboxylesterase